MANLMSPKRKTASEDLASLGGGNNTFGKRFRAVLNSVKGTGGATLRTTSPYLFFDRMRTVRKLKGR